MRSPTLDYDAIILGAGAAGLMCAAVAGQGSARVLVIDHADAPGRKILISGGGRCNFTNLGTVPERFLSDNPRFATSALRRYTPTDFVAMIDRHGIAWHEKTLGQLFCDGSARQVVAMLLAECPADRVTFRFGEPVRSIDHADGAYRVDVGTTRATAPALVLATGGPAIPRMGATGFAYDVARRFGLRVVQPRPALVPLTLGADESLFRELSGVAAPVVASVGRTRFAEAALFTHRGLSGPAILQASSYWRPGEAIGIDFLPDRPRGWLRAAKRERGRQPLSRQLAPALSSRLADTLAGRLDDTGRPLADWSDRALDAAEDRLRAWAFHPTGTEGYAKAEVTGGGIDTRALSSRTMEAVDMPGLHAIGEAVDVTGWLGGYNFQWAWASGHAAGEALQTIAARHRLTTATR